MPELISVVVPVYNAGEHLTRCLDSLTRQTYPGLEIILVDDGSTDGSRDVIRACAEADGRIVSIMQPNRGVSAARNAGIEAATGDLIGFVDADDWLEPDTYELLVGEFDDPLVDFVTFGYFVDHDDRTETPRLPRQYLGEAGVARGLAVLLQTQNRFVWTRLFRRDLLAPVRFRGDIHWGEDTVFAVEAAKRARSSTTLGTPLYHYVQSAGSATRSRFNPKRITGLKMTHALEGLISQDHPQFVDDVARTRMNIIGILFQDAYASEEAIPFEHFRSLRRAAREDLSRILRSRRIPPSVKFKGSLIAVSPRLFVWVHHVGVAARSLRSGFGGAAATRGWAPEKSES